jgi:hypothetical protein
MYTASTMDISTSSEKRPAVSSLRTPTDHADPDDLLVPSFDSLERKSTILPATFNLVATIVGGGVLSLPLAFEKCGIAVATILMVLAAWTNQSLQMLCISARQTGAGGRALSRDRPTWGTIVESRLGLPFGSFTNPSSQAVRPFGR